MSPNPISAEEKAARKAAADLADKSIIFSELETLQQELKTSKTMIVFFGANWCGNTQKFNPHYLKAQQMVLKNSKFFTKNRFLMRKMECSVNAIHCDLYKVDGYPTIHAFVDGVWKEEYNNQDDENHLYNYILNLVKENPYVPIGKELPKLKEEESVNSSEQYPKVQNVQYFEKPLQKATLVGEIELPPKAQSSFGIYIFVVVFLFSAYAVFVVARRSKKHERYKKVDSERNTSD